jgi:ribosomal protein S18 acetylase RimI-like enzyme
VALTRPESVRTEVRTARPDEYLAVGRLVEEAYRAAGHLDRDSGYADHLRDVAGRADAHPVLVAVRGDALVGSVTITPYGTPHSHDAGPDELEFRYLGVARDAWGTGVAEPLVTACEGWALEHGASALVISVIAWNEPALRLYGRLGFRRVPERDREPAPGIVLCALVKDLAPTTPPPGS